VVLGDDITIIDPVNIRQTKVLQTYVGGKKVFDSEGLK
jgi:predicted amidohydrolase YtcJ